MKRILVIDGGGVKGIAPAIVLRAIEQQTRRAIAAQFDLIVGSSVGAILGSVLATGRVSADALVDVMTNTIPSMFRRRIWPRWPKYRRQPFREAWHHMGLDGLLMAQVRTRFMCTAMSYIDNRTHFFKSWHQGEAQRTLYETQLRSWAAPFFFGKVVDEDGVWADGGCGLANCPLAHAITQTVRLGWLYREPVHVLSLGTGFNRENRTRRQAERLRTLGQVGAFLNPDDGGWARYESAHQAVLDAEARVGWIDGYSFQRIDLEIPAKMDKLDQVKYLRRYMDMGREMARMVDYEPLLDTRRTRAA